MIDINNHLFGLFSLSDFIKGYSIVATNCTLDDDYSC